MMQRIVLSAALCAGMLAPTLAAAVTPPPSPAFSQKEFTDVSEGNTYYDAVEYLRVRNIIKGYPDGSFRTGARITRAEFLSLMTDPLILDRDRANSCMAENIAEDSATVFYSDVGRDTWYADPVCWGTVKKIINGYPDGTFKPNQQIIFAEAAKMLSTVFQLQIRADDTPSDDKWFTAYVQKLAELNAIPTTIKKFDQIMTRGEISEMVYRLHADVENKASMKWTDFPNR